MMATILDSVRDSHSHPMARAAGLFIAVPGTYLLITDKSVSCALAGFCADAPTTLQSPSAITTRGLSVYESLHSLDAGHILPVSSRDDKSAPTLIVQIVEGTRRNIISFLLATAIRIGIDIYDVLRFVHHRWAFHYPVPRFDAIAVTTALLDGLQVLIRTCLKFQIVQHSTLSSNTIRSFALATTANKQIFIRDLLVTAWGMVSFESFQKNLARRLSLRAGGESVHGGGSAVGLHPSSSPSVGGGAVSNHKDAEIQRLRKSLAETQASEKNRDVELKRVRADLCHTQEKLDETVAENSDLRNQTKAIKQTIGRDHQAIVYRKDIELFALRKGNEQKENSIRERDSRLAEARQHHRDALAFKDAQIQNLEERFAILAQRTPPDSPDTNGETHIDVGDESQPAVQVKLLRVKGRSSQEHDRVLEYKEMQIAQLKADLASISRGSATLERVQDELRRAWSATYEMQTALTTERERHAQTQHKLEEIAKRLDDELCKGLNDSPARLPTIDESDKQELEAMFNATQEDNFRLYTKHEALDKRLREANARAFAAEQEREALQEQLRLEKAINEDMETARPNIVHRVHFQRMEGQLKESHNELEKKKAEIVRMKNTVAAKDGEITNLKKEKADASKALARLEQELEKVNASVAQLEATKQQLMLDHERLARQRARHRTSSAAEYTSARCSGATLVTDSIVPPTAEPAISPVLESDIPPPPTAHSIPERQRPVTPAPTEPFLLGGNDSIQNTPERVMRLPKATPERADRNHFSMISADLPPPELRTTKRRTLNFKSFLRKIVRKDGGHSDSDKEKEKERERATLATRDGHANARPRTSAAAESLLTQKAATAGATRPRSSAWVTAERPDPLVEPERPMSAVKVDRPLTAVKKKEGSSEVRKEKVERPKPVRYYPSSHNAQTLLHGGEASSKTEFKESRPGSRGWGASGSKNKSGG
jgi:hypothetical protein